MPALIKCSPEAIDLATMTIKSPRSIPFELQPGDDLFIWLSETQGGGGLCGHAFVDYSDQTLFYAAQLLFRRNAVWTKDDLAQWRDSDDAGLLPFLARNLYKHAHNKVLEIDEAIAGELRSAFGY